jgi:hypothetical protein
MGAQVGCGGDSHSRVGSLGVVALSANSHQKDGRHAAPAEPLPAVADVSPPTVADVASGGGRAARGPASAATWALLVGPGTSGRGAADVARSRPYTTPLLMMGQGTTARPDRPASGTTAEKSKLRAARGGRCEERGAVRCVTSWEGKEL